MTTNQILNLDFRVKENQEIIQKVLRQVKPLSKYSDEEIPFSALEKAITVMCKKYVLQIKDIMIDSRSNDTNLIWRVTIANEVDLKVVEMIYGISLYEVFAKTVIKLYSEVKKGIQKRS